MTWGLDNPYFCVVESEIDGILLNQVGGDMAGIIALGSAQAKPDELVDKALNQAESVLVCLDGDLAGATASWRFWALQYPVAFKRWPCPTEKDPGEAYKAGLDLRAWLRIGIGERNLHGSLSENRLADRRKKR
jgi:DNA primase